MEPVLCKDCKHSFIPLQSFIWHGFNSYAYKCKISFKEKHEEFDPVLGPKKIKGEYQSCGIARIGRHDRDDRCGEWGKFWEPKHKKDLFKFIRHISR